VAEVEGDAGRRARRAAAEDLAKARWESPKAALEVREVRSFTRRKPARRTLPEHLPRERVVYPVPQIARSWHS